jgi:four helix bundle protein
MAVNRFEDLEVWKLAKEYCDEIGAVIRRSGFRVEPKLRDSLNENAISVVENIAEGFEREGRKEFARFTRIAKASNGEGRADLHIALGRALLTREEFERLHAKNLSIARMLRRLLQRLIDPPE